MAISIYMDCKLGWVRVSRAGLMESANLAQCPKPFNVPTIVALEENFENVAWRERSSR